MWDRLLVFAVLLLALGFFAWGRWRYDLVALAALLALVLPGVVPADRAFLGFGHPAVITVAAVLVLSRGLMNSGVVDLVSRFLLRVGKGRSVQVGSLTAFVAICSGFMNNVGALALILPVAVRIARSSGRSPSYLLIPVAFASLLGGLTTMIGTPPNIIVASFRADALGRPFSMFDFTPVGAAVAAAGVLFLALIGWRLIPQREGQASQEELFRIEEYTAELRVPEKSKAVGKTVRELDESVEQEVLIISIVRNGRQLPAPRAYEQVRAGDILLVESDPQGIAALKDALGLEIVAAKDEARARRLKSDESITVEAVVRPEAPIIGRTVRMIAARWTVGVNLLAVARQGQRVRGRLRDIRFAAGDVLLLQARPENVQESLEAMGCLPLAERNLRLAQPRRIVLALGIFIAAILAAATGKVDLPVAFVAAAAAMVLTGLVSLRDSYDSIEWPVIVLLGAMIPVGAALESTGGAELVASWMQRVGMGQHPIVALTILLIVVMTLSDIVNNAAAAVIMCPVAIALARGLDVSPDPFLMAVAVGSSAAFLTPIGHQSNTLVYGPGGYKFGDYWRLGLPLETVILALSLVLIPWAWPF